jgi:hypothetical protein
MANDGGPSDPRSPQGERNQNHSKPPNRQLFGQTQSSEHLLKMRYSRRRHQNDRWGQNIAYDFSVVSVILYPKLEAERIGWVLSWLMQLPVILITLKPISN